MGIQKSSRIDIDDMQAPERVLSPDEARKVRGGGDLYTKPTTTTTDPLLKDPIKTATTTIDPLVTDPTKTTTTTTDPYIKYPVKP